MASAEPADHQPLVLFAHQATERELAVARSALGARARVMPYDPDAPADERERLLKAAEVLLVRGFRIPAAELGRLHGLRFVQRVWAGVERLPFDAIRRAAPDVVFAGNPGPNADAVAEHAVGLYLACAKRIPWHDRQARAGSWSQGVPSRLVHGQRIGVLGLGAIGGRVATVLSAMGAHVVGANRDGRPGHVETTDLEGLRAQRGVLDGLVLAAPATRALRDVVDHSWLSAMKEDAILVNVARGSLVDPRALYEHLLAHPRFTAGLDAQWHYPQTSRSPAPGPEGLPPFPQAFPWHRLDNVVMTPHVAWNVPGVQDDMLRAAAENVARFLAGETAHGLVDPADYVDL